MLVHHKAGQAQTYGRCGLVSPHIDQVNLRSQSYIMQPSNAQSLHAGVVEGELQKRARLRPALKPAAVLLAVSQARQHTQRARLGLRVTKLLQIGFGFAGLLRSSAVSQVRRRPPDAWAV